MSDTCGGSGAHSKTIVLRGTVKPKQTNADRIRSMTDEELSDFLGDIIHDWGEGTAEIKGAGYVIDNWLDWLKQEVE